MRPKLLLSFLFSKIEIVLLFGRQFYNYLLNGSGELVRRIDMGQQFAGSVPFSWDGKNEQGDMMPNDRYTIKAESKTSTGSEQLDTLFASQVISVSIAQGGGAVTLNLAGLGSVPIESVREIN